MSHKPGSPTVERRTASECITKTRPKGLPSERAIRAFELLRSGLDTKQIAKKLKTSRGQVQKDIQAAREHEWSLR